MFKFIRCFVIFLVSALLIFAYGCGSNSNNTASSSSRQTGTLAVKVAWPSTKTIPAAAAVINLSITKSDSSISTDSIQRSQSENSFTRTYQELPIGSTSVSITALNSSGTTVATGSATVDIIANSTSNSTVSLTPTAAQVPTNPAFVANENDGTISVIDTDTETVAATIPVGGRPTRMDINTTQRDIVVANPGNNTVSTIDLTTLTVTDTVSVTSPTSVLWGDTNFAFVTNLNSQLLKINLDTGATAATFNLQNNAILARYNLEGIHTLYLFEGTGNPYEKLNFGTEVLTQTAGTEGWEGYVTNASVWVIFNAAGIGWLRQFDRFTDALGNLVNLGVGANPMSVVVLTDFFPPSWDLVLVACPGTNQIAWLSSQNFVLNFISVSGAVDSMAANNDNTKVYITCRNEDAVKVLTTSTMTITNTISVGDNPKGIIVKK